MEVAMDGTNGESCGSRFERAFVGLLSLMSGAVLIYQAIKARNPTDSLRRRKNGYEEYSPPALAAIRIS
jgi:hypothetical protein